mgnify:CR=1 FL=1
MDSDKRGSFNQVRDLEAAKDYDNVRFSKSKRMQRLDTWEQEFAKLVFEKVGGQQATILDMPCGNGRFFETFKGAQKLSLYDYAPTMLEALVAKHPEAEACDRKQGDIMTIPMDDGSVDLAFSMRLFHHIEEAEKRQKALSELSRVSKKWVAISFYDTATWRYIRKRLRGKTPSGYAVGFGTLEKEARDVNLRIVLKHPSVSLIEQQRCVLFEKTV